MRLTYAVLAAAGSILVASPASAADCSGELGRCPTPVPEPSALGLFAGGLAGLVIGRRIAKKKADTKAGDEQK
jgi:hypothetical protein